MLLEAGELITGGSAEGGSLVVVGDKEILSINAVGATGGGLVFDVGEDGLLLVLGGPTVVVGVSVAGGGTSSSCICP
jgi:hypothetical protein